MKQESLKKQKAEQAPSDLKVSKSKQNTQPEKTPVAPSEASPAPETKQEANPAEVKQPEVKSPEAKPRQIKYAVHEVIVIKTKPTMGIHIKKNEQNGDIFVSSLVPGSDAEQSNIKQNDVILSVNGINLTKNDSLSKCANLMANPKEYVDFKLKRIVKFT